MLRVNFFLKLYMWFRFKEIVLISKQITFYGMLACANIRSATRSGVERLWDAENERPTCEKRRSTEAEVDGQPRYWRAITSKFGNLEAFSRHHSCTPQSSLNFIWGSARYSSSSSRMAFPKRGWLRRRWLDWWRVRQSATQPPTSKSGLMRRWSTLDSRRPCCCSKHSSPPHTTHTAHTWTDFSPTHHPDLGTWIAHATPDPDP